MRKTFELENLECANCAAKMERDISAFHEVKKGVSAICAAPMVLGGLGILKGKHACCYPSFEKFRFS